MRARTLYPASEYFAWVAIAGRYAVGRRLLSILPAAAARRASHPIDA